MTKPTGRPRGRPPGSGKGQAARKLVGSATGKPAHYRRKPPWGLTEAQLATADPLAVMRALLVDAVRRHDRDSAFRVAVQLAPYLHSRPPLILTPEMLREFAQMARAEMKRRRGLDLMRDDAAAPPAKPN